MNPSKPNSPPRTAPWAALKGSVATMACASSVLGAVVGALPALAQDPGLLPQPSPLPAPQPAPEIEDHRQPFDGPQIEVAFVLDTTGSMSGLIDGAKRKIWSIASEILETEDQASVRFGLVGYRDRGDDYITIHHDLTADMNGIYGHLLEFEAAGGGDRPESVNRALHEAVTQFDWTSGDNVLRLVFLVGDAPPHTYGDEANIAYDRTCETAQTRGIVVNTVLAGGADDTRGIWKAIAALCDGAFMEIPQDGGMQTVQTPYDEQLNQLQRQISQTIVPYGRAETRGYIAEQQADNLAASSPVATDMAAVRMKGGKLNRVVTGGMSRSDGGDLVEDVEDGRVVLTELDDALLPDTVRAMAPEDRIAHIDAKIAERAALNAQMADLVAQRDAWLADELARRESETGADAFDLEVKAVIRAEAAERGITYKEE